MSRCKGRSGALVETAVMPRALYLFESNEQQSNEEFVGKKTIGKNKKEKQQSNSQKTMQKGADKKSSGKAISSSRANNNTRTSKSSSTDNVKNSKKEHQQHVHPPRQQIQVLPLRGLAIDNRTLPNNVTSETMAIQSFLGLVPRLIKDGLDKGVLSSFSQYEDGGGGGTIVAALVHGAKCLETAEDNANSKSKKKDGLSRGKGRSGALVETAVVPRASYLFEPNEQSNVHVDTMEDQQALWLTNLVSPINKGFAGPDNDAILEGKMDGGFEGNSSFDHGAEYTMDGRANDLGGSSKYNGHNGFKAADSWSYFGDLGKLRLIHVQNDGFGFCLVILRDISFISVTLDVSISQWNQSMASYRAPQTQIIRVPSHSSPPMQTYSPTYNHRLTSMALNSC